MAAGLIIPWLTVIVRFPPPPGYTMVADSVPLERIRSVIPSSVTLFYAH